MGSVDKECYRISSLKEFIIQLEGDLITMVEIILLNGTEWTQNAVKMNLVTEKDIGEVGLVKKVY